MQQYSAVTAESSQLSATKNRKESITVNAPEDPSHSVDYSSHPKATSLLESAVDPESADSTSFIEGFPAGCSSDSPHSNNFSTNSSNYQLSAEEGTLNQTKYHKTKSNNVRMSRSIVKKPASDQPGMHHHFKMPSGLTGNIDSNLLPKLVVEANNGLINSEIHNKRKRRAFKPSSVWDHFLRVSDGNVQCLHCAKILKRKDSSTKSMWGHLRAIHFKGYDWASIQYAIRNSPSALMENLSVIADTSCIEILLNAQNWLQKRMTTSVSSLQEGLPFSSSNLKNRSLPAYKQMPEVQEIELTAETSAEHSSQKLDSITSSNPPAELVTSKKPYVKRSRSFGTFLGNNKEQTNNLLADDKEISSDNRRTSLIMTGTVEQQQIQHLDSSKIVNCLADIPRASEAIKITHASSDECSSASIAEEVKQNSDEASETTLLADSHLQQKLDPSSVESSSICSTDNHLQVAASYLSTNVVANPFLLIAAANALPASNATVSAVPFSLEDTEFLSLLVQICKDLNCRFTYEWHNTPLFRLQSLIRSDNTAIGQELILVDLGNEIRITESENGLEVASEAWHKMDFVQFSWALRGKCHKFFVT